MKLDYNSWRYSKYGDARIFKAGEEIDTKIWADTPDAWKGDDVEQQLIDSLSKDELVDYGKSIGLKLDKRSSKNMMVDRILEHKNDH